MPVARSELVLHDHNAERCVGIVLDEVPGVMKGWVRKKKVLLLGEELLFAGTLKLELQRDPRLDVKFASWGKDAVMMIDHYGADMIIADVTPCDGKLEDVLVAVRRQNRTKTKVLATAPQTREIIKMQPLLEAHLAALAPDAYVAKLGGMRPMLIKAYELLDLPTKTQTIRRQA